MRTTMRIMFVLGLVFVLLMTALPVHGSAGDDGGVIAVNDDFLVPAGTPELVYAGYVADTVPAVGGNCCGLNIAD